MNQTPLDEGEFWSTINLDNPLDLHGDPPYDVGRVADRIISSTPNPARCLDMGCGIGRLTNHIATRLSDSWVYGFDISKQNVFRAVEGKPGNALYWRSDGRTIPSGITGHFDLIWSVGMLQHIPHDAKYGYISQAAERLHIGGVFVFTVAVGDAPPAFLNHQLTEHELEEMCFWMLDLFGTVSKDHDPVNDWTWLECRK